MLQAAGLSYTVDPRFDPLFEDLSFSLLPGEKVALMGANGAGKTTLLRLLTGELQPASGRVIRTRGCQVAYLPQDFDREFVGSLDDFVDDAAAVPFLARFELLDRLEQDYHTLSPGEKMRAALAKLIAGDPDLLLLDEPTNHLDLEARLWLEEFLDRCRQGVLMVCHDRAIVNAVVSRVVELERGGLTEYKGGYDDMKRQKAERIAREMSAWERERHEAKRLKNAAEQALQRASRMVNKSRIRDYSAKAAPFYNARAKGVDKRAQAIRTRVTYLESHATAKPYIGDEASLTFPAQPMHSSYPLSVRGLRKAFGEELFAGLNFDLERGQRIALVGPNGGGKTTLMRMLLGEESVDGGEIHWSSDARPAHLSQTRTRLDLDLPLIEALGPETKKEEQFVRTLLGRLKIQGDAITKEVGVLSVGERTKAEIVKMLMSSANVLLLDEPTNHLDIESLEALEEALLEFPGSVLFTSHDRAFIERVADEVVLLG